MEHINRHSQDFLIHARLVHQDTGSVNPAYDCIDLCHGEEVSGGFLEPIGQASHVFHFAKEALDDISLGIEIGIVRDWRTLVVFREDYGDLLPDLAAAVGFVRDDGQRRCFPVEEDIHHLSIVDLTA